MRRFLFSVLLLLCFFTVTLSTGKEEADMHTITMEDFKKLVAANVVSRDGHTVNVEGVKEYLRNKKKKELWRRHRIVSLWR